MLGHSCLAGVIRLRRKQLDSYMEKLLPPDPCVLGKDEPESQQVTAARLRASHAPWPFTSVFRGLTRVLSL